MSLRLMLPRNLFFHAKRSSKHVVKGVPQQCRKQEFSTRAPLLATPSESWSAAKGRGTHQNNENTAIQLVLAISTAVAVFAFAPRRDVRAKAPTNVGEGCARQIRLAELSMHDRNASRKWVLCGTRVFDITDFIPSHPGGEIILRACGGSIDPYWKIFSIHQKQEVRDILDQFCIGELDQRDIDKSGRANWASLGRQHNIGDPFQEDPTRDPRLLFHSEKPCNAETPAEQLGYAFITPLRLFFVRNHLWVPRLDPRKHSCTIELPNGDEKAYSVEELKARFPWLTVTVTLQCAGNRRAHMSSSAPGPTAGLQWGVGAISTANFTGVRLRDVLRDAGYDIDGPVDQDAQHIHLSSPGDTYAASVPSITALAPASDAILAFNMNGEALPADHGGPLRAVIPGTVAARSVKWVGRISFDVEEAWSQWQRRDYKCFGPNVRASDVAPEDWDAGQSIQDTPVQSAITSVRKIDGRLEVRGYAYSGGGRAIIRVDVSPDCGRSWKQASLLEDEALGSRRWAWRLWRISFPEMTGDLAVKAVDDSYNAQPESFDGIWNFRGLLATAWHQIKVL